MCRAFTIVELVIAIGLVALVAALALPAGVSLLASEGRRSGVFVCEAAVRSVRDRAMRDRTVMVIGAIERDGAWALVARPYATPAVDDDAQQDTDDDPPAWDAVASLPEGFAFRFEPLSTVDDDTPLAPEADPFAGLRGSEPEPERVALVLPSGAVEGVDTWRLVTETESGPRVDRLRIARWTGAITAEREASDDPYALVEPEAPVPAVGPGGER
ncbi:MAG: hypothetical protein Tsb0013_08670 [Phycisphaerales bacterium]